ncbi:MAG: hypothetical protein EOM24_26230 [Chloroflexia bacterium]|nr:hypothetical protein [Chloroflexia bacterium]
MDGKMEAGRSGARSGTRFGTRSGTRFGTRFGTRSGTRPGTRPGTRSVARFGKRPKRVARSTASQTLWRSVRYPKPKASAVGSAMATRYLGRTSPGCQDHRRSVCRQCIMLLLR